MEQRKNHLELGFEIAPTIQTLTSKWSPGTAIDYIQKGKRKVSRSTLWLKDLSISR
jgi:hypothetical protein